MVRQRLLEIVKEPVKGVVDRFLFDLPPHGLDGIQVGRLRGELDEFQSLLLGDEIIYVVCPVGGGIIHDDVNFWSIGIFLKDSDQKRDEAIRIQPLDVLEMALTGKRIDEPENIHLSVRTVDRQRRGLALPYPSPMRYARLIKGAFVLEEYDFPFLKVWEELL